MTPAQSATRESSSQKNRLTCLATFALKRSDKMTKMPVFQALG
jgi:hypothetical protein